MVFLITNYAYLDIKDHNLLLIEYLNAGYFPFPPGYYSLIYFLDLLIRIRYPFVASAAIVLTIFFWWKYRIVFNWIRNELAITVQRSFFLTLGLLFLSPLYLPWIDGDFWYLGKFTATTWHNSTLIAVFPISILLLKYTLSWLDAPNSKMSFLIIIFGILIALFKPSFLFCFIPSFPLFILIQEKKISRKFLSATGISVVLFVVILIEKFLIFHWDPMNEQLYPESEKSQVVIAPFKVWLYFSDQPIFDFLSSFPLLVVFLFFWKKSAFRSHFFSFSLLNLFFALLVYAVFAETGFREYHGNFYWQIPIALFLNNLSICLIVVKQYFETSKISNLRFYVLFGVFSLQAILGLIYWLRIFLGDTLS
jgi:hypothetical protein